MKWVNLILGRLYDLALWPHPWPWPWSWNLKVKVWNSYISGMGTANSHGMKRMWVIHSWPWYWLVWPWWGGQMSRIVTGVTSDVGVPSTYLVITMISTHIEGILPKGPYLPCVSMAVRALLAGCPRYTLNCCCKIILNPVGIYIFFLQSEWHTYKQTFTHCNQTFLPSAAFSTDGCSHQSVCPSADLSVR